MRQSQLAFHAVCVNLLIHVSLVKNKIMVATVGKKMKYEQFRDMEIPDGDTNIYELINGEIEKRASPNTPHQDLHSELFGFLFVFNKKNKLGKLYSAPFYVVLDDENVPQPDIFFISKERNFIILADGPIMGAPDLIIEIISPGTARYDRGDKKDLYERFQVKEYWIDDPRNASVEVYKGGTSWYLTQRRKAPLSQQCCRGLG
jgi:Uma2 family endonuclease